MEVNLVFKFMIMEIIDGKEYYSQEEFDEIIHTAIRKNSKDLADEIKRESKFRNVNEVIYV
ncbi:hypothetical protein HUU51_05520 [Candidatus Gracilibacteria bacterium]|nr:hypothetical protein [Candidatus Gracilibacteria bacterium]